MLGLAVLGRNSQMKRNKANFVKVAHVLPWDENTKFKGIMGSDSMVMEFENGISGREIEGSWVRGMVA